MLALIRTLNKLKAKDAIPTLRDLLFNSTDEVIIETAHSLGILEAKDAIPDLIKVLQRKDSKSNVFSSVIQTLVKLNAKEVIPFLINPLLNHEYLPFNSKQLIQNQEFILELISIAKNLDQPFNKRIKAIKILTTSKNNETVSAMISLLEDRNEKIRQEAFFYLQKSAKKENIPQLEAIIKGGGIFAQDSAIYLLTALNSTKSIPLLLEALKSKSQQVRVSAAYVLTTIAPENSVVMKQMMHLVENKNEFPKIRFAALNSLSKSKNQEVILLLSKLFCDKNEIEEIRINAIYYLENIDPIKAEMVLLSALTDNNPIIQNTAIYGLARLGVKKVIPLLIETFNFVPKERTKVLNSFKNLNTPETTSFLLAALKNKETAIRVAAIKSLETFPPPNAIPNLIEALDDQNLIVASSAANILSELNAKEAIPAIINLLNKIKEISYRGNDYNSANAFVITTVALNKLGYTKVESEVIELLKNSYYLQQEAILVLGSIKSKNSIPYLKTILNTPNLHNLTTSKILEALGNIGDNSSIPLLINALTNEDNTIRSEAIKGLGALKAKEAIPYLTPFLEDTDLLIRNQTKESLAKINQK